MRAHLLGVRGSIPAPGLPFVRYGGNTSCVALAHDGAAPSLVLDAGTGIRGLSTVLDDAPFDGSLLLTHLHWDHVEGLPFCTSMDRPDARTDLLLPAQPDGTGAAATLARMMSPPNFPIGPEGLIGTLDIRHPRARYPRPGGVLGHRRRDRPQGRDHLRLPDRRARPDGPTAHRARHWPTSPTIAPPSTAPGRTAGVTSRPRSWTWSATWTSSSTMLSSPPTSSPTGRRSVMPPWSMPWPSGPSAGAATVVLFHHSPRRTDDRLDEIAARYCRHRSPTVVVAVEGTVLDY